MGLSLGAYLPKPVTDKESGNGGNETMVYGVSSMQGWRDTQEDAHNCILDFDSDTSFFAVYDGHGGNEVAEYTSKHLPDFLKNNEHYKNGDFEKALKDSFVKFDSTLKDPTVVKTLQKLAKYNYSNEGGSDSDEENLGSLKAEAQMPIEEVMAKYVSNHKEKTDTSEVKETSEDVTEPKLKKCEVSSNETECSSSKSQVGFNESDSEVSSSSSSCAVQRKSLSEKYINNVDEKKNKTIDSTSNGSDEGSGSHVVGNESSNKVGNESEGSKKNLGESQTVEKEENKVSCNGSQVEEAISSSVENGEVEETSKSKKGKSLVKHSQLQLKKKPKETESSEKLFQKFIQSDSNEDSESDSDEDATFNGPESKSDDDDDDEDECNLGEGEEGIEEEDEDEDEDDDEDDEDDDSEACEYENEQCFLEPGYDSGCTALVALIKDQKLFVANAGDCRCVVSKNGKAIEMSFDHKPENDIELKRIEKAGGRVNAGRVNDGLNLSRALGDHVYKRNENLAPEEQMISPLPDIKTLNLDPDVEFMVLACDGIWNSMSSKEVINFIRPRLQNRTVSLADICEEIFDHCLAPDTLCDGTGCDNMTAIIVEFKNSKIYTSRKRHMEDREVEESAKKQKTEDVSSTDSIDASQTTESFCEKASNSPDTTQ